MAATVAYPFGTPRFTGFAPSAPASFLVQPVPVAGATSAGFHSVYPPSAPPTGFGGSYTQPTPPTVPVIALTPRPVLVTPPPPPSTPAYEPAPAKGIGGRRSLGLTPEGYANRAKEAAARALERRKRGIQYVQQEEMPWSNRIYKWMTLSEDKLAVSPDVVTLLDVIEVLMTGMSRPPTEVRQLIYLLNKATAHSPERALIHSHIQRPVAEAMLALPQS